MNEQRKDYTVPQVAKQFNCSANTVKGWIKQGKMKAYRLGGDSHYRVPWAEVDRIKAEWTERPDLSQAL